jgi:hypothetical protein
VDWDEDGPRRSKSEARSSAAAARKRDADRERDSRQRDRESARASKVSATERIQADRAASRAHTQAVRAHSAAIDALFQAADALDRELVKDPVGALALKFLPGRGIVAMATAVPNVGAGLPTVGLVVFDAAQVPTAALEVHAADLKIGAESVTFSHVFDPPWLAYEIGLSLAAPTVRQVMHEQLARQEAEEAARRAAAAKVSIRNTIIG